MRKLLQRLGLASALIAILTVLVAGSAWWFIHTRVFTDIVRSRLLSQLREATGGLVELGVFEFDPTTLNIQFGHLVIHGTEPASAPPLLQIDSVQVGLKILSFWRRDVDLQSVRIMRPQIHILVDSRGVTNIPKPKRRTHANVVAELLKLKIKQLEVKDGTAEWNNQQVPFQFASHDLALKLSYDFSGPSYVVAVNTDQLTLAGKRETFRRGSLTAAARLFEDRLIIDQLQLTTGENASRLRLSGEVDHFASPAADAVLYADLSLDELAKAGRIEDQLRHGRITLDGKAHLDAVARRFHFGGSAHASSVEFTSPHFALHDIRLNAEVAADNDGILLRHVVGETQRARFEGNGVIKAYRFLEAEGRVSNVALKEVGAYLTRLSFPWNGTAFGTARATATLRERDPRFVIRADVDIEPGKTEIPTSGHVEVSYDDSRKLVTFGDSTLQLPNSIAKFSGVLESQLALRAQTANTADLAPILPILGSRLALADLPVINQGGNLSFNGSLQNLTTQTTIQGVFALNKFRFHGYDWDSVSGQTVASETGLAVSHIRLTRAGAAIAGSASAQLANWTLTENSPFQGRAHFSNLDVVKTLALVITPKMPVLQGVVSGNADFSGTINQPHAQTHIQINNVDAYGEQLNQIRFDASLNGNRVVFDKGRVQAGPAVLTFSGVYDHAHSDWSNGQVQLKADSNGFPLVSLATVRKSVPNLDARAEFHVEARGNVNRQTFQPLYIAGGGQLHHVTVAGRDLGGVNISAVTRGTNIDFSYSGDLRSTQFQGAATAQLEPGTPIQGELRLNRISLDTLRSLVTNTRTPMPLDGFLDGRITFGGPLESPSRLHAQAIVNTLQVNTLPRVGAALGPSEPISLNNNQPLLMDVSDGVLRFLQFEIDGRDTTVNIAGSVPLVDGKPMKIKATGKVDLALFSMFDPNVLSSGHSELEANISGSLSSPEITGDLQIHNGSFFLSNFSNGLSDVEGAVQFTQNRATIQKMTAHSGGGDIALGGSVSFGEGGPLVYHLDAEAREVRVRYANSISVTSNASLRLNGTSTTSLLSGSLSLTRVVFTPNADVGNLLAATTASTAFETDQTNFFTGLHLDIGVESAPNLQVSTNLSRDVEAEIELRLRGTPQHPIVLGNITANQGDIKIFGTRFSLNRGEISFVNTVRIEPVLDLDLETQARGVTVDITAAGTPSKLNINYRSDPPLQPRDIIALLTVGRAPDLGAINNAQGGTDFGALSSGVNTVLGQAISPVSNRLSKLFGIANVRIDPFVQGITNTPQARLSVEQQVSKNVTVTYVTNLSQTSEQIFRFELALSRQFSVVAIRDDNGEFGIDFQYKKRFK